jgi:putative membrane protein (TIGR04086 family)
MDPSYQPPTPPPALEPRGFFSGIRVRPVIVGAVVDYVATHILIVLYLFASLGKDGGVSEEALEEALRDAVTSQDGLFTLLLIGALGTILGGYIAGRIAKTEEVKHGALVGAVSLILAALQAGASGAESLVPYWYQLSGYLLAIPVGALGGYLAQGAGGSPAAGTST